MDAGKRNLCYMAFVWEIRSDVFLVISSSWQYEYSLPTAEIVVTISTRHSPREKLTIITHLRPFRSA